MKLFNEVSLPDFWIEKEYRPDKNSIICSDSFLDSSGMARFKVFQCQARSFALNFYPPFLYQLQKCMELLFSFLLSCQPFPGIPLRCFIKLNTFSSHLN